MHKKTSLLAFLTILLIIFAADSALASTSPVIVGGAAIIIDSNNGQVLYEKNSHQRMYPASTTKTLTAIIALENSKLSDQVKISSDACNIEGSAIGLQEGESVSMEDLLYALMLNSGNDTAIAIAQYIGGSVSGFVEMMNKKAGEIGALDSHFNNPHGLPDLNHYSSAYDLAIIGRYAMKNPEFRKIVSTKTRNIHRENPEAQTYLLNRNNMLWNYEGAIGIKTGYTDAAGQCLVTAANRQNRELITVVLNSVGTSIWDDTRVLLDYGFAEFNSVSVINAAQYITDARVKYGAPNSVNVFTDQSLSYNFPKDKPVVIRQEARLIEQISAPIKSGDKLGELVFFSGEREIGRVDLVSRQDVEKKRSAYWWPWLSLILLVLLLRSINKFRYKYRRRDFVNMRRRKYY
ncbi:D-alanyl-D-alanine carboxypeptidase [Pelotomaculum terephthalicicum JT]|uniref:D-alanyl-D-alanine carboxypeptidase family protein n=1 Tax=Pelotomaculum TaxID=191373 RepID=UPI0009D2D042|nr:MULTISPECIES: D-alanyl-D-alanine carboxypeptidase family protein [Pelotomaculum]MCG9968091.1 D-alanyl-D-alanine carboxypeptidase [Pelotomaculum terephthalicicum JT]OPX85610.1 MAG: D-alanyl-D-alanine carboxypeptidase DacB precursor [Pelotomaculum sp. PtaB.Bin117]OPY64018.1 MAG: D-alanyl-D-alanine carboxypeptidase DacB precursor [Pelotomaculum sp. PtaU1.Bin065]